MPSGDPRACQLSRPMRLDDPESRAMTPGQRWRFRRDLVILAAARAGASHRLIADVFDLPHSRVSAILKNLRARHDATTRDED